MTSPLPEPSDITAFIARNWDACIRETRMDTPQVRALPFPYVVPCASGRFDTLFYWDTYFTNLGLLRQGRLDLAKANVDNLLYEVRTLGFVPNSNGVIHLNQSQPPYLAMMVRDVYAQTGDRAWLATAFALLQGEYRFWMEQRAASCGLNRYFCNIPDDRAALLKNWQHQLERLHLAADPAKDDDERLRRSLNAYAEYESGWDMTPRFEHRCAEFAPVDLNSNLYLYETFFADFAAILGGDNTPWRQRAAARRELMNRFLWDEQQGLFLDWDFVNDRRSRTASLATFHPLWAGLATPEQAAGVRRALPRFERAYGLCTCEPGARPFTTQWDAPNAWAPLHWIAVDGLRRQGFPEDADRIAGKFRQVVADNFQHTGNLWEKYNAEDGSLQVGNEYDMPPMLGWTAGIFLALATAT
jgi:alpha,alpha-trehalase